MPLLDGQGLLASPGPGRAVTLAHVQPAPEMGLILPDLFSSAHDQACVRTRSRVPQAGS